MHSKTSKYFTLTSSFILLGALAACSAKAENTAVAKATSGLCAPDPALERI